MEWAFWAVAALLGVLVASTVAVLVLLRAERRRNREQRTAMGAELEALRAEVRDLERRRTTAARDSDPGAGAPDHVITLLGDQRGDQVPAAGRPVSNQLLLSAAFGEPLVKVLALGHGLRRAVSPESRNRIGFEVRREVRRTRKVRRREMRQAWRAMRADRSRSEGDAA